MSKGTALTDLILDVFRLNGALLAAGDELVGDLGLTSARWQVLGAIALSPSPLPVAHIARNMGLSRQNVQRIVDDVAASGLIAFAPNPHHRRAKLVLLTARGRSVYAKATERQKPWAEALANGLDETAIRDAATTLRRLHQGLEAGAMDDVEPAV